MQGNKGLGVNTPTFGTSLFVVYDKHMRSGCKTEVSSLLSAAEVCALFGSSRGQTSEESSVPSTQRGEAPGPSLNTFFLFE